MAASGTATAPVAHHFDNLRQQQAAVKFGMWLFLVTEVLFFGGVFCTYTVYRHWFPRDFEAGSAALNVGIASVNTFLLLLSSLTITLGIRACHVGDQAGLRRWLILTMVLGSAFLGLKMREYYMDYEEGLIPGHRTVHEEVRLEDGTYVYPERLAFGMHVKEVLEKERDVLQGKLDLEEVNYNRVQLFFLCYYIMTGLHVLHMVVGIGLLLWQYILARIGFFRYGERHVYVEVMSLYWHFVDMVWMFLFPMLYLAGPHSFDQAVRQFQHALGMH